MTKKTALAFGSIILFGVFVFADLIPVIPRNEQEAVQLGLIRLINAGKLRPANASDIADLSRALTAASPSGNLATVEVPDYARYKLYVVLGEVTLPDNMTGANSATFIVPQDMPMPMDRESHNTFYRLVDGGCMGPGCYH